MKHLEADPTSPAVKIFGREPAVWIGLIEGVLTMLLAFAIGIDQETFGPIMAVVVALGGAYTAWATKDTLLGALLGLAKALLVLMAVYGMTLTDQQTGAILGLISLVIGFWQRTQTSPVVGNPPVVVADRAGFGVEDLM